MSSVTVLIAILLAKLLDPVIVIIAIIVAVFSSRTRILLIAACVIGAMSEFILMEVQVTREFGWLAFALGSIAAFAWLLLARKIFGKFFKGYYL